MSTLTNTLPEGLFRAAVAAHDSPPRAYHSWAHVQDVLEHMDIVPHWSAPREVTLAIVFHDAIYEPGRSDNEARSAEFAERALATFGPHDVDASRVRELIELTARHGRLRPEDVDDDARHFLDCDMAILGRSPTRFDAYDAAIAVENAHVPGPIYRFNRRRFLSRLLEAPRIFLSDFFHARLDAAARANLRRALDAD
ncbi:MAG: hypothetical protein DI536_22045 [Archangium gephyra]|uniref:Metal-dependent HD superfamily phosphohydrolase n=1 Tax=Archangium gephyra TaxID=48 RepID=A0A2W5VH40_9BACT|nr:MAG: hypothetical protein DI536_22045 [Archangium gephyra]